MTERSGGSAPSYDIDKAVDKAVNEAIGEAELAWAAANLPLLRRWVTGTRFLYQALAIAFVSGLIVHIAGYVLAGAGLGEPAGLIADLLTNLGIALWTGTVLVAFVQVLPETQRRAAVRLLEKYEAAQRDRGLPAQDDAPAEQRPR
jgi:hypothetical protein